ncbi:MAG TPA: hypothetical protein VHI52_06840 [Verrucomicrobiae bacterium]|nr:hypothetical protein [Verrucomicrobiae bacterium]
MEPVRRAVIDVGTNSIKLLIADVGAGGVQPVWESSRQTRLGRSFYKTHRLQPEPILQTAQAVAEFAAKAHTEGATSVRVIATSAARDAVNTSDLVSAIQETCGLPVEIISGATEADWAFRGVATDPHLTESPLLLLDVGGGSTEFILGHGQERSFCESFRIGTVRMLEQFPHSDPPTRAELTTCRDAVQTVLREQVGPKLSPLISAGSALLAIQPIQLIGTGGTASILGCMESKLTAFDRAKIEGTRLSRDRVTWHVDHLWGLPLELRKRVVGLPPNRADVILTGAVIYEMVMEFFRFEHLRITTRGLRFAALMDPGEL